MPEFVDERLDDPEVLQAADHLLRPLAQAGARLRRDAVDAEAAIVPLADEPRPRAVVAVGPEARLLRAVLEPVCPVPFVAWPSLGLPGWVGPLDLVVVLGGGSAALTCAHEALRRGSRVLVTAPEDSSLARQSASRATTLLPVSTNDPLTAAIVALLALQEMGLGTPVSASAVAAAMDAVAVEAGHAVDVSVNPAKAVALELADAQPLVWGGSVLAARASRRIAESLRTASGRVALAADASELLPILASTQPRDPFADPFEGATEERPVLVLVDDGFGDEADDERHEALEHNARVADVRVCTLTHAGGTAMERYATVLAKGRFAAAYLQIGLGRVL
ncbi:MAG: SIS domain-containing protein [Propioniciclava sp.]|uniref:SIS domain-containing protein n=1 Tax=Propioniciclava sp. TaxID=2038686 RepID=UPI0039E576E6